MKRCFLYRHFDGNGSLLYVGVSLSWLVRTMAHRSLSAWFCSIRKITITPFRSSRQAFDAETKAIRTERPKYNIRKAPTQPRPERVNIGMEKLLHEKLTLAAEQLGMSVQAANEQATRQWLDRNRERIQRSANKLQPA